MEIIFMTIIISLILGVLFLVLFIRLVKKGQYDDVYTPSVRMLFDDEIVDKKDKTSKE